MQFIIHIATTVNTYFATSMDNVIDSNRIIELGIAKYGSQDALCNAANVSKSTLWRLRYGRTSVMHAETIGKLVKALND